MQFFFKEESYISKNYVIPPYNIKTYLKGRKILSWSKSVPLSPLFPYFALAVMKAKSKTKQ